MGDMNYIVRHLLFLQASSNPAPSSGQSFGHKNYDLVLNLFENKISQWPNLKVLLDVFSRCIN